MKRTFMLFQLLFITVFLFGQAKDITVVHRNVNQPAATILLPYEPGVVSAAMDEYLSKYGLKIDDTKGFQTFRITQFVRGDSMNADLYFKVVRNRRGEKGASIIYLMVGVPNEGISKRNEQIHFTREQAKEYLNKLVPVIEAYNLELLIIQQNDIVMKEEMIYNNLVEDGAELNKRKTDNQQQLQRNKHDQDKQNEEVERQKLALDYLVSQRKS